MRFEVIPGSPLPDQLRNLAFRVIEVGPSQRTLANAITEQLIILPDGPYGPVTEGSTANVKLRITHLEQIQA